MITLLKYIKTYWIACTLFTLAGIIALSLWPQESLPSVPGTDKSHHLIAYAALVFPTALRKPAYWKLICLFFIACGGIIELAQPYVNRYGEWLDLAANTTGILCGLLIAELLLKKGFPVKEARTEAE
jgi:VanZ family protein